MTTKIDYLAITGDDALLEYVRSLGPTVEARGILGYERCLISELSGIRVYYKGGPKMGVHLRLSGEGCDNVRADLPKLLQMGRASRIDLAIDEFPISPLEFASIHQNGLTRKLSSNYRLIQSNRGESPATYYAGARQSEKMLRLYTKAQGNRLELELKGKTAIAVQKALMSGQTIGNCIRSLVSILAVRGSTSSRDIVLDWWRELGTVISVSREKIAYTLDRTIEWVRRSVMPSLAQIVTEYPDLYNSLLSEGLIKWHKQKIPARC